MLPACFACVLPDVCVCVCFRCLDISHFSLHHTPFSPPSLVFATSLFYLILDITCVPCLTVFSLPSSITFFPPSSITFFPPRCVLFRDLHTNLFLPYSLAITLLKCAVDIFSTTFTVCVCQASTDTSYYGKTYIFILRHL